MSRRDSIVLSSGLVVFLFFSLLITSGFTSAQPVTVHIQNDSDFSSSLFVVDGSGTAVDPWIIEGHKIDASDNHGIWIEDTDDYFLIRHCVVENGGSSYDGIRLENAPNGKIDNVSLENNNNGVYLSESYPVEIVNSSVDNSNDPGLYAKSVSGQVTIENNIFKQNFASGTYAIRFNQSVSSGANVELDNNRIENCDSDGIYFDSTIYGFVTIKKNKISESSNDGIEVNGFDNDGNVFISNNEIISSFKYGIHIPSSIMGNSVVDIENNLVNNNGNNGIHIGGKLDENAELTIDNNSVKNNSMKGIEFSKGIFSSASIKIYRNKVKNNDHRGIEFERAIYSNVKIGNNFIENNRLEGIELDEFFSEASFTLVNNDVCGNGNEGILFGDYLNENSRITIENNLFYKSGDQGINIDTYLYDNAFVIIEGNRVENNGKQGVRLYEFEDDSVLILDNNLISGNQEEGINFYANIEENSKIMISNNEIYNNLSHGIFPEYWIGGSSMSVFENNVIVNNTGNGINFDSDTGYIKGNAMVTIENNLLRNPGYRGINLELQVFEASVTVDIVKNIIDGNTAGVWIDVLLNGSLNALFNDITNNTTSSGVYMVGSSPTDVLMRYNNLINCLPYGVNNNSSDNLNALYNWWGTSSGSGGQGSGGGENISSLVLYDPWLDAPSSRVDLVTWSGSDFLTGTDRSFTSDDGRIEVSFDAVDSGRMLAIEMKDFPRATPPSGMSPVFYLDISTNPEGVTDDAQITVNYSEEDVSGLSEESLMLYCWNSENVSWQTCEDVVVDTVANEITGKVPHLSPFGVFGSSPASLGISNLSVEPSSVESGESVSISATVTNSGGVSGTYTAVLRINGQKEDESSVTVGGGSSEAVSFGVSDVTPGTYSVNLSGLAGSFEVLQPANFEVRNLDINPSSPYPGYVVLVSCDVVNTGDLTGGQTITLKTQMGKFLDSERVVLEPGERQEVTFEIDELRSGETYKIAVAGLEGEFTVRSTGGVPQGPKEPGVSGFVFVAIVLSVAVAAFSLALLYRESR